MGGIEPDDEFDADTFDVRDQVQDRIRAKVGDDVTIATNWCDVNEAVSYALDVGTGQEVVEIDTLDTEY